MEKVYNIRFIRDLKDEVASSVKKAIKTDGGRRVAKELGIKGCYIYDIGNGKCVPLRNLTRCIKAARLTNASYYYAAVAPNVCRRYDLRDSKLPICGCSRLFDSESYGHSFESELFEVDNKLYKKALRYWRVHLYNGRGTINDLCVAANLSDRTIFDALHERLNPKCSTIQKLLSIYGCRLVIIKSPCKLTTKHIKMIY